MWNNNNNNGDESFLGLGYHHNAGYNDTVDVTAAAAALHPPAAAAAAAAASAAQDDAADAVQALMRQCLSYHEEQEAIRQQQQQQQQTITWDEQRRASSAGSSSSMIHFVRSTVAQQEEPSQQQTDENHNTAHDDDAVVTPGNATAVGDSAFPNSVNTQDVNYENYQQQQQQQQRMEEAKARAQAILARFQQQQQELLFRDRSSSSSRISTEHGSLLAAVPSNTTTTQQCWDTTTHDAPSAAVVVMPAAVHFAEQRRIGLAREEERKQRALLKNLEYVAARQDERIRQLNAQVQETAVWEQLASQRYQADLEQRRQRILLSAAAAAASNDGTVAIHCTKKRKLQHAGSSGGSTTTTCGKPEQAQPETTVAIYVSGLLPLVMAQRTAAATTVDTESYVRQLFGGFGTIAKVHLYREKLSSLGSQLKGDGLVVYKVDHHDNDDAVSRTTRDLFVETVCAQMNGAELPCGSVLTVEPAAAADSSYYNGKLSQQLHQQRPQSKQKETAVHPQDDDSGRENCAKEESRQKMDASDNNKLAQTEDNTADDLDEFFDSLS